MSRFIIVVSGAPASGKTYLSKIIQKKLEIPVVIKDEYKEILFDYLGCDDEMLVKKMGVTSFKITEETCRKLALTRKSFLVEGNFQREYATETYREIAFENGYEIIHIYCYSENRVLYERYQKRAETTQRHKGHKKMEMSFEEYELWRDKISFRLDFERIIEVDTSSFDEINYENIINQLRIIMTNKSR